MPKWFQPATLLCAILFAISPFVIADATLFGIPVALGDVIDRLARKVGLERTERVERELPAARRYLPPPGRGRTSDLTRRMRHEVCLGYLVLLCSCLVGMTT